MSLSESCPPLSRPVTYLHALQIVYLANPKCSLTPLGAVNLGSPALSDAGLIPAYNLKCTCAPGEYMDDNGECNKCDAGQFSVNGIVYDDNDFFMWDLEYMNGTSKVNDPVPGVTSYCLGTSCDGWSFDWGFGGLQSGDNWNIDNIESDLVIIQDFQLEQGNQVSFVYRVDAEDCWLDDGSCDGFAFYVNNEKVLPADPKVQRISKQLQFTTFTYNLTQGTHMLRWVYTKDDTFSGNEDKAFLQTITLTGAYNTQGSQSDVPAPDSCHYCPVGSAAPSNGSSSCETCDWFEYQSMPGSDRCLPCDNGTMSAPGSAICISMSNCTSDDYYRSRPPISTCVLQNGVWVSNHSYSWDTVSAAGVSRKLCYGGATLPPPVLNVPCKCSMGSMISAAGGTPHCVTCPLNQYGDGVNCYPCNSSSVPVHAAEFTTWMDPIGTTCTGPNCISTSCIGDCAPETNGWVPRGGFVSSGRTIGTVYSTLTVQDVPVAQGAHLIIQCEVDCFSDDQWEYKFDPICDLNFTLYNSTGAVVTAFSCQDYSFLNDGANNTIVWKAPVADDYTLVAAFWQNSTEGKDLNHVYEARIYSIVFDRLTSGTGSVVRCEACPLGTSHTALPNQDYTCTPCPIGQQSTVPPSSTCVACTGNTINPVAGRQCLACGATTTANTTNTGCDTHGCTFTGQVTGRQYNFMPLSQPGGTMFYAGQVRQWGWPPIAPQMFYLNPCTTSHNNKNCYDANNQSLPYMACQTTQDGIFDLGSIIGFLETGLGAVTMTFTGGTPCGSIQRETNVSMVCDVGAGFGSPRKPTGDIEGVTCRYNFEWYSQYACPVCRDQDYQLVAGVCNNGRQRLFYVPLFQCSGSKSDSYVPCTSPTMDDVPAHGFVFIVATVALINNTSPDMVPFDLSNALGISSGSIIVVLVDNKNVTLRVTVPDVAAIENNITSNLGAALASAQIGTLLSTPNVVHSPVSSSSSSGSNYMVPVIIVILIALVALAVAGVFFWKNRQLRYQNYRLVKEAGQDNGIANELYNDENEEPVLRPTGTGMRFLNQNTSVNFGDDDDDLAS